VSPFFNPFFTTVIVSIAVLLGGCGDDASESVSSAQRVAAEAVEIPPVVEWYPTPKHQHRPQYFMPPSAPAASQNRQSRVTSQPVQQQFSWGGNVLQPVAPQGWMVPVAPATGYGAVTGVPAQGYPYAPAPAWGQNVQPVQPPLQQAQPVQQQYYPLAPQNAYVHRPWGAASKADNSGDSGQSIQTWQTTNELPAWSAPAFGGYPVYYPGSYGTHQGTVAPGYYR
jgi:hypothetical protein